jgi:coenzyme F420-reducing hydrogenase delta subunit
VDYAKKLIAEVGLEEERVSMVYMSSAMGAQFAEAATEMTESLRGLGPSPLKPRTGVG